MSRCALFASGLSRSRHQAQVVVGALYTGLASPPVGAFVADNPLHIGLEGAAALVEGLSGLVPRLEHHILSGLGRQSTAHRPPDLAFEEVAFWRRKVHVIRSTNRPQEIAVLGKK